MRWTGSGVATLVATLAAALLTALAAVPVAAQQSSPAAPPSSRPTQENDNAIFNATRLELDGARSGGTMVGSWDGEGWIGTDFTRFWWKTQGEQEGSRLGTAEVQALYSRYVAMFWDFQAGVRHTFRPGGENYLVVGMEGLAPYRFEVDGQLFLSQHGRLSGRGKVDYELLWTNHLISRPGITANVYAGRDVAAAEPGGIGEVELRFPTRYEITRQFAPYVEARYTRAGGRLLPATAATNAVGSGWTLRGGVWLLF